MKIVKLFHNCLEGSLCGTHAQAISHLLIVGHVVQCVAVEFTTPTESTPKNPPIINLIFQSR